MAYLPVAAASSVDDYTSDAEGLTRMKTLGTATNDASLTPLSDGIG